MTDLEIKLNGILGKTGDVVKVYCDPIDQKRYEGEAKLLKFLGSKGFLEFWEVEFVKDNFRCNRWIKAV